MLIVGNHLAVVCLQQAAGVGRFGAGNSCLTECIVQLKCFSDKGQFFCRYRQGIIVKLCQRVAVNERLCMGFLGGGMRLFIDGFSVLCDFYDVGVCVADCNAGSIRICFHFRFNEDTACDFRHFHFDNTGGRHVPRGLCLLCGNTVQTFQPFIRVSPAGPQCRGVAVTNLGAVGDSAGKRVLEHTAVQPQSDMFYRTGSMLSGCGNNKGNRARLGHTQSRAHILPDKFCQFMHSLAPLECSLLKMPRRGLRRSGDIF